MRTVHVGIDPGVQTGFASWDAEEKGFLAIDTLMIHEAMDRVLVLHRAGVLHSVTYEDARLRKWLGSKGTEALQGAGSIKRDCAIWADFLGSHGIAYRGIAPQAGATKWPADQFKRITGWAGRTSNHARDAAILVFRR